MVILTSRKITKNFLLQWEMISPYEAQVDILFVIGHLDPVLSIPNGNPCRCDSATAVTGSCFFRLCKAFFRSQFFPLIFQISVTMYTVNVVDKLGNGIKLRRYFIAVTEISYF